MSASPNTVEQFRLRLQPQEQLKWVGRPILSGGMDRVDQVMLMCAALLIAGFILVIALTVRLPLNPIDFLLVLVFAAGIYTFIVPSRKHNQRFREASAYALTDQRVLLLIQPEDEDSPVFVAQEITQLVSVSSLSWSQHAQTLCFGLYPHRMSAWDHVLRAGFDLQKLCLAAPQSADASFPPFLDLEEADYVQEMLLSMIRTYDLSTFFSHDPCLRLNPR
jgi:hypothetical protein